jgi:methylated-DNA-[protein]-cysteine S-methyltransferase
MTASAGIGFSLFETPIGRCGIAWGGRGLLGVQLPEGREEKTRARVLRRLPGAREGEPPRAVARAVAAIQALLRGEASDLSGVALDMQGVSDFQRRVYEAVRRIPPGQTRSYGEVAALLGERGLARAVGVALGRNPFPLVVPCHRVLAASGRLGGFSAQGGVTTKLRLLRLEGAPRRDPLASGDGDGALGFDPALAEAHLRAADPLLARVIDAVGPCRLELQRSESLFGALAEAIVYQQLAGRAAATIHARLCALFPGGHAGPTPEQILRASDAKLRGTGLSAAKLLSLRDLARRARAGEIPTLAEARSLPDAALVERLTAVRGIGRWTVEMLLIFRLGRPDVLPVDDLGVRSGFSAAARRRALPAPKELARYGERWAPYRTAASWYLWRAAERGRAARVGASRPR